VSLVVIIAVAEASLKFGDKLARYSIDNEEFDV
jgi:hypothetical protein